MEQAVAGWGGGAGGEDLVERETARFRESHGEREMQSWTLWRSRARRITPLASASVKRP